MIIILSGLLILGKKSQIKLFRNKADQFAIILYQKAIQVVLMGELTGSLLLVKECTITFSYNVNLVQIT